MSLLDYFKKKPAKVKGEEYRPNPNNTTPQQRETCASISNLLRSNRLGVTFDQIYRELLIGQSDGYLGLDTAGAITPDGTIEVRYPKVKTREGVLTLEMKLALDLRRYLDEQKIPYRENIVLDIDEIRKEVKSELDDKLKSTLSELTFHK